MTQDTNFPYTSLGVPYPKHYVVGVIDDLQEAERAVQALLQVGFTATDIRLRTGQEVLEVRREHDEQKPKLLTRIVETINDASSDDELNETDVYAEEASEGHNILNVYARTSDQITSAQNVLAAHYAHTIKYFGDWTITELPSS